MRKIRIAQIGTSRYSHGSDIFFALSANPDVFEIVGYALPENEEEKFPDRIKVFEGYRKMSVEEIMADKSIEAVTVETEEIYLTKYALMAAKAGKHVHMEKPGGVSLEDFEEMITVFKEKKTVFHTGYMYRYNPVIVDIIKRVKAGEIGKVISVEAQMCRWDEREATEWFASFEGGMMFYLGCHLIDLVYQIQGMPKRIITCNNSSGKYEGVNTQDHSVALFEYENGSSYIKASGSEYGGFSSRRLLICGTEGRFEICPLEEYIPNTGILFTEYTECRSGNIFEKPEKKRSENFYRYFPMMLSFAQIVRKEKENPFDYDYELELFKLIKRCCK